MALKVDLRQFLDDKGNELALTEQAKKVFNFVTKIVLSVSQQSLAQEIFSHTGFSDNIEQPLIDVDLKCNTRGDELCCCGHIEAGCNTIGSVNTITWQCDTCAAAGTISNWQGSLWDKQKRTMH
ncbi:hypothetical protein [Colwellia piezophila]|uniref:hypothetical protein n=1 Tax=Colwellia piezophila TaxID=211668 RepID=UPI00036A9FB1|nr:hypothetical protein [Colwellia piezophila]